MTTDKRIDALYEAAQKATPGLNSYDDFVALSDPQTVTALIEVYRAAKAVSEGEVAPHRRYEVLNAAIEKVEGLQ